MYSLHFTSTKMYSLHFTVYIYENVQFTFYSLHCTVYILFYENENQFTFDIYKTQMYSLYL